MSKAQAVMLLRMMAIGGSGQPMREAIEAATGKPLLCGWHDDEYCQSADVLAEWVAALRKGD